MWGQEMVMKELNMEILPEAAKREMLGFYEYLVDKYTKKKAGKQADRAGSNKVLVALQEFKRLRERLHPVVDPSVDIDKLIDTMNHDIF